MPDSSLARQVRILRGCAPRRTNRKDKVVSGGERGRLGLAFHPQYESNGRFFVYYTRTGDGTLVLAKYHASPPSSNSAGTAETVLLTNTNHNGGMLAFGPYGYL
jgi:glucose/arabinose dehydrogenase